MNSTSKQDSLVRHLKTHFFHATDMLESLIEICPDQLWNQKHGGYIFWQQILHALSGNLHWTRQNDRPYPEPFAEKRVFPELEQEPENQLAKSDLRDLARMVRAQNEGFFSGKPDAWLTEPCAVLATITNIDVIAMQIRHLQYHVGHCDSILREHGAKAADWIDYLG